MENPVTKKLKELNLARGFGKSEGNNPKEEPKNESKVPDSKWLIKDKFENTPEGIAKMAKAYSSVQSQFDKKYNPLKKELDSLKGKIKPLLALDKFISDSPEATKAINTILDNKNKKDKGLVAPKKPEDFNVADIYEEGTSSYEFHQAELDYREAMGVQKSNDRIDKLEQKLSKKETDKKDFDDLVQDLSKAGLSKEEIESYLKYTKDPTILTPENQIIAFRAIRDKDKSAEVKPETETVEGDDPAVKPKTKDKPVSAIAEAGTAGSAVDPKIVEKNKFWQGIMKHSNYKPEQAE